MLKVVDALPESHRDTAAGVAERLLIDPETDLLARRLVAEEVPDTVVTEVRRAVFAGHKLRIHYAAADQAPTWRTVDPIGLVTVRGQGYLLATRSGADRTYRLSRILAAEELAEPAQRPDRVAAVVSRGGRPDLAGAALPTVRTPTLLVVGGDDDAVITLNEQAVERLGSPVKELVIVPGASHLFEDPGKLEQVARLAADWFARHLTAAREPEGV